MIGAGLVRNFTAQISAAKAAVLAMLAAAAGSTLVGHGSTTVALRLDGASFSPRALGAYGGANADSQAIVQAAIDAAYSAGGGNVLIDATYRILSPITVKPGVNLVHAQGGKLVRGFDKNVSGPAVYLQGDNFLWNVHWDGGSGSIAVSGTDYTLYQDFTTEGATGGLIWAIGGQYKNSCGSFFICRTPTRILGVNFGEYLDHCVYSGDGGVSSASTTDVCIDGCSVNAPNATREVFKARNGIDGFRVLTNYVNAPNAAAFLELSIGDAAIAARQVKNVFIDGNRAITKTFLEMDTSDASVLFENIRLGRGNVGTHTSYIFTVGAFPSGGVQNGVGAKDIYLDGRYTTTLAGGAVVLSGDLTYMIEYIDMRADLDFVTNEEVYIFGNIKALNIAGRHKCTNAAGTAKVINQSAYFAYDTFKPTILGTVTVRDAVTDGYVKNIFNEVSNGGSVTSGFRFNLVVEHCTMLGPLTKQVFNCSGPKVGDATGTAILRNNTLDGASTASAYKVGYLIEESRTQKVLQSPDGTKYALTVANGGAVGTAPV